tara:strand:+ start:117 stop:440 length:324 start_codon:yes stop_codon:yes gene_type:complete
MKKLLQYIIIRLTTRHASTALKIYESIFGLPSSDPVFVLPPKEKEYVESNHLPIGAEFDPLPEPASKPMNKKEEIKEALVFLKGKDIKSKRDKGSISMLEGVLATMV